MKIADKKSYRFNFKFKVNGAKTRYPSEAFQNGGRSMAFTPQFRKTR